MQHQITIEQEGAKWIARFPFSYATKDLVKDAGFRFDPARKLWWTDKQDVVDALDPVKAAERAEAMHAAIEASKATDAVIDVPAPAGLSYLPYQLAGIAYALNRASVLIGDEMGLGKTIQAIGVINADPSIKRVLVICPASLKLNWQRELRKWLVRPMIVAVANGAFPSEDVVIINYDILAKHRAAIDAVAWDLLVVDEVHYVKNPSAKRSQMILGKRDRRSKVVEVEPITARRRVFMTGTPIVNRPIELFPLVESLDPTGLGSNFFQYAKRYCAAYQGEHGWDFTGASNLPELQQKLRASVMVRRLKQDVLTELPPKRRQVVTVPATGAAATVIANEKRAYDDWQHALRSGDVKAQTAAFSELSRLRHQTGVTKIPQAIEFVREALESDEKLVVFAHHHDVVHALEDAFGDAAVTVTGETAVDKRMGCVDRFQNDPSCKLFIGGIAAAGVGLTLTAATHVIFVELDWVPGNMTQAEDRCHRIGQRGSVFIQHFVFDDSLDARMGATIISKQEVIEQALDRPTKKIEVPEIVPFAPQPTAEAPQVGRDVAVAANMPAPRKTAIHRALRLLAGQCDGAMALDGAGFNRLDATFGHRLAGQDSLTDKQAAAAARMVIKYKRQLPATLLEEITK